MPHVPRRPGAAARSAAFLVCGALAVTALAGCGSEDQAGEPAAGPDVASAARAQVKDGGTLRWAVDDVPQTLNSFQADADAATSRIAGAVLPSMFRLDAQGRPQADSDYLEKAEVIKTEPKQVVLYKLNQQAVWSDGREIGAADFAAQWRALSGKNSAYWTAHNAGYNRIEKVERGKNDLEVRVTFGKPYADWRSLFSPLYPKDVMGTPDAFNEGARKNLKVTAGPFALDKVDRSGKKVTLDRNPRWWGRPAKLEKLQLTAVPRDERPAALADGRVDLAGVDQEAAERIAYAARDKGKDGAKGASGPLAHGPGSDVTSGEALRSWARAHNEDWEVAEGELEARAKTRKAVKKYAKEQAGLDGFVVRKSLEPAYTQLALNGSSGPLADERVRQAVARALDRTKLAESVLKPLGLPAATVGSHLALSGQAAYADNSDALGKQDADKAQALLAEAGWVRGGPLEEKEKKPKTAGGKADHASDTSAEHGSGSGDGTYIMGEDDQKPGDEQKHAGDAKQGAAPGAYAPKGTAAPEQAADKGVKSGTGQLAKDGKPLTLNFVLPSGEDSEQLRAVADRISAMLQKIGVRTDITKVDDADYFKDHIAAGDYDLALYSWPGSAYPATDGRPIYAKPVPAADGSLTVEQNYTRVGTDHIDQLFDQAVGELDEEKERSLVRQADERIWAAAGSIPLYQRPELVAAKANLVNAGAFGFQEPDYEDIGFLKPGAKATGSPTEDAG
ncbi:MULTISPECIES: ABC transporter family substrate-binding protein [unclassified Streptomyces]|uniref:ABC transporter family substrate-binding protein n=1 Tax=unclassified Streptomyces TaxID=2593676 RepID=UPI00278C3DD5|nr:MULTISPECIES: ABC transporter family substrate-binding protein [unclassified Streptomyces]